MPPSEDELATAREWLQRAKGNLARAKQPKPADAFWEDQCFDAQQAAEKAVKAVLLWRDVTFPYMHDIEALVTALQKAGHEIPEVMWEADDLSRYAVETRYPGAAASVSEADYRLPWPWQNGLSAGLNKSWQHPQQTAEVSAATRFTPTAAARPLPRPPQCRGAPLRG